MKQEAWREKANCKGIDMFPDTASEQHYLARRVCVSCPVKWECRAKAIFDKEIHGVWGGTTEIERRRMIKRRFAA